MIRSALAVIVAAVLGFGAGVVHDQAGNDLQLYGGTARYDTTTGWYLIDNATHSPLGLRDPTCDRTSGMLEIMLDVPATHVVTSWADADETLTLYGITVGASVGTDRVYLRFMKGSEWLPCQSAQLALRNANVWVGGIMLPSGS